MSRLAIKAPKSYLISAPYLQPPTSSYASPAGYPFVICGYRGGYIEGQNRPLDGAVVDAITRVSTPTSMGSEFFELTVLSAGKGVLKPVARRRSNPVFRDPSPLLTALLHFFPKKVAPHA